MEITCCPITEEHLEGEVGLRALREVIATELFEERGGPLFLAEAGRTTIDTMLQTIAAGQAHLLGAFSDGGFTEGASSEGASSEGAFSDGELGDGALVGWAYVRLHTLPDNRILGIIDELAVHPDGRQIGAGELLLEHVLAWCRTKECIGVDSYALPGARETKNFFETFGMKARLLTVHVPLLDPAVPLRVASQATHANQENQATVSTATPA
jgi:GNAT superfamily N-acetyltransferase